MARHQFISGRSLLYGRLGFLVGLVIIGSASLAFAQESNIAEKRLKAALIAFHVESTLSSAETGRVALAVQRLSSELEGRGVAQMILTDPLPVSGWLERLANLQQARLTQANSWPDAFSADEFSLLLGSQYGSRNLLAGQASVNDELFDMLFASNVRGLGSIALQHLEAQGISQAPANWYGLLQMLTDVPDFQQALLAPFESLLPLSIGASVDQWLAVPSMPGEDEPIPNSTQAFGLPQVVDVFSMLAQKLVDGELEPESVRRLIAAARMRVFVSNQENQRQSEAILGLATAMAQLKMGRHVDYLATIQALGVAMALEWQMDADMTEPLSRVVGWLRQLATTVEPMMQITDLSLARIHAETLQTVGTIIRGTPTSEIMQRLASLMASLKLVSPRLDRYLDQPFRTALRGELDICFVQLHRETDELPPVPITQEQFMGCARGMADWATQTAAQAELSGDSGGPFEPEHLGRQLELDDWQRVNYWHAYTDSAYSLTCTEADQSLVNPIEWSIAARAVVLFADRWPAYSVQPDFRIILAEVAGVGEALADALRRQIRCPESSVSPIAESLTTYSDQLAALDLAIRAYNADFRRQNLREGADIDLSGLSNQETNYRPPELKIDPCSPEGSCGMGDQMDVSRALLGLFPSAYLAADQLGLGALTLCYDNVEWVDRRSELPRAAEKRMARFLGKLSFELYGRYDDQTIFAQRLTGQTEYEYLFGENSDEVLDNSCPRELIGTKVESILPARRVNLVPRRLSYMTADRTHPSRVFAENWEGGEEWKDWFVTGRGVESLIQSDGSAVEETVVKELRSLQRQLDRGLLAAMLADAPTSQPAGEALAETARALDLAKRQLQAMTRILATNSAVFQDNFRAILRGDEGLLDRGRIRSLSVDGLPSDQTLPWAQRVLGEAEQVWQAQAELAYGNPGAEIPLLLARNLLEIYALERRYINTP